MNRYEITNDRYSNEPAVMTADEFQAYLDEMGWADNVELDARWDGLYNIAGDERELIGSAVDAA